MFTKISLTLNFFVVSIILACFFPCPAYTNSLKPLHVFIDPGHGGTDSGAVYGKAKESDIVLKVGLQLKNILAQDKEFTTSLSRESDAHILLRERVKKAELAKSDLFLSIHVNASQNNRARGVEFYFQNHLPPDEDIASITATENQTSMAEELEVDSKNSNKLDTLPSKKGDISSILEDLTRQHRIFQSYKFSQLLYKHWNSHSGKDNNSVRQAPFHVVSKVEMPSVLIELGFLTNPIESEKLINKDYQFEISNKIYSALKAYKLQLDQASNSNYKSHTKEAAITGSSASADADTKDMNATRATEANPAARAAPAASAAEPKSSSKVP